MKTIKYFALFASLRCVYTLVYGQTLTEGRPMFVVRFLMLRSWYLL
jgi:hypothetical protein